MLIKKFFCNFSGAEIRSVCSEAGMIAIRARRKIATEKDFRDGIAKVVKSYAKFSSTPRYRLFNWSWWRLILLCQFIVVK